MSDLQERQPWYVEPLNEVAGSLVSSETLQKLGCTAANFDITDQGVVMFFATYPGISIDTIIYVSDEDKDAFRRAPWNGIKEVRERLDLKEEDMDKINYWDPFEAPLGELDYINGHLGIGFRKRQIRDAEAMFLLALPLASAERPVEKVLEEIRTCARLGMGVGLERVDSERELFDAIIHEIRLASEWDNTKDIKNRMYEIASVKKFVSLFAEYQQTISSVGSATDKTQAFKKLVALEHALQEQQALASAQTRLGRNIVNDRVGRYSFDDDFIDPADYTVAIAREIANIRDEEFTNGFPYLPVSDLVNLPPAEKARLKLVILPADYKEKRRQRRSQELREAASAWDV